jgi:hypothetical protein
MNPLDGVAHRTCRMQQHRPMLDPIPCMFDERVHPLRDRAHFLNQRQLDVETASKRSDSSTDFLSCINSGISAPTSTANATAPTQRAISPIIQLLSPPSARSE